MTVETQVAERWVECQAKDRAEVHRILRAASDAEAFHAHCFWYEPWFPEGAVVRVHLPADAQFDIPCIPWDAALDAEVFGEAWPWVQRFFQDSTLLGSMKPDEGMNAKLVHCYLNAQGLDVHEELAWALRFAKNRVRMCWADRRRLVRRLHWRR